MSTEPARDHDDLSPTSYVVLGLVALHGRATSYDLKQAAQRSIGNFWSFPHSQLYAEPRRLAERGLLHEEQEEGGRRRRTFQLTDAGQAALRAWLADPGTRPMELRDESLLKLAFAAETDDEALAALARAQQETHRRWRDHYDTVAEHLPPGGPPRFARATLEMGRRYRRLAEAFWGDVEQLARTGEMPVADPDGAVERPDGR